jgi:hypothetical protein
MKNAVVYVLFICISKLYQGELIALMFVFFCKHQSSGNSVWFCMGSCHIFICIGSSGNSVWFISEFLMYMHVDQVIVDLRTVYLYLSV